MSCVRITITLDLQVIEQTRQLTLEPPEDFALSAVRSSLSALRAALEWKRPDAPWTLHVTSERAVRAP